jgi:hypothetical protein
MLLSENLKTPYVVLPGAEYVALIRMLWKYI